jgi:hypothetical protein
VRSRQRRTQYLFLNGRWIRDRSLGHALQEGYRGLLMTGRYAVAFLFLDMPPDLVDVNVHPTKVEVRFRDSHAVYHLFFGRARSTAGGEPDGEVAGTHRAAADRSPAGGTVVDAGPSRRRDLAGACPRAAIRTV